MARRKLAAHVCETCKAAPRSHGHPGLNHAPGICDCPCRDGGSLAEYRCPACASGHHQGAMHPPGICDCRCRTE